MAEFNPFQFNPFRRMPMGITVEEEEFVSPYADLAEYVLNRPAFNRGARPGNPLQAFRNRANSSSALNSVRMNFEGLEDQYQGLVKQFEDAKAAEYKNQRGADEEVKRIAGEIARVEALIGPAIDPDLLKEDLRKEILAGIPEPTDIDPDLLKEELRQDLIEAMPDQEALVAQIIADLPDDSVELQTMIDGLREELTGLIPEAQDLSPLEQQMTDVASRLDALETQADAPAAEAELPDSVQQMLDEMALQQDRLEQAQQEWAAEEPAAEPELPLAVQQMLDEMALQEDRLDEGQQEWAEETAVQQMLEDMAGQMDRLEQAQQEWAAEEPAAEGAPVDQALVDAVVDAIQQGDVDLSGGMSSDEVLDVINAPPAGMDLGSNYVPQGLSEDDIQKLIDDSLSGATGGFLDEADVNKLVSEGTAGFLSESEVGQAIGEGTAGFLSESEIDKAIVDGTLTEEDINLLIDTKQLTKEDINKLIEADRLSPDDINKLIATNQLTEEDINKLIETNQLSAEDVNKLIGEAGFVSEEDISQAIADEVLSEAEINKLIETGMSTSAPDLESLRSGIIEDVMLQVPEGPTIESLRQEMADMIPDSPDLEGLRSSIVEDVMLQIPESPDVGQQIADVIARLDAIEQTDSAPGYGPSMADLPSAAITYPPAAPAAEVAAIMPGLSNLPPSAFNTMGPFPAAEEAVEEEQNAFARSMFG